MRKASTAGLGLVLCGCMQTREEVSIQRWTLHGAHEIEFSLPGRIDARELEAGLPAITVRGPDGMKVCGVVFDDADGDSVCDAEEFALRFLGRPVRGGVRIDGVHARREVVEGFRGRAKVGLDVAAEGKRHWHAQGVE